MKRRPAAALSLLLPALCLLGTINAVRADDVFLSKLNLSHVEQDYGRARADRSVDQGPITLGGRVFEHGVGTHAKSIIRVELAGRGERFQATVGVDDEKKGAGSVVFRVLGDDKEIYNSGLLRGGDAPKDVSVDLTGVKTLLLVVDDGGDGISSDHADWADARFTMKSGQPEVVAVLPPEPAVALTPPTPPTPGIHGAKVFGVRPGAPFLFTVAATGDRPMTFAADGLPAGLQLDPQTGRITGVLGQPGEFPVTLHAKNARGETARPLRIVCGAQIGLTPAMGWNSWNCYAGAVTADDVRAAADAMVSSGLANHGFTYVNIDDFWQVKPGSPDPTLQGPARDAEGRILPNPRFPDMKGLADYVHAKGLKIGIYSSPGPLTCGGCVASWQHEAQDAKQYADWGYDYLKYDWCSYDQVVKGDHGLPAARKPYEVMRDALRAAPRDILFSFCQYGMADVWKWGAESGGNSWRTTGDITDTWASMAGIGFHQNGHEPYAGPGHFNDPDMLVVGQVGWGSPHPTRLRPSEQYAHISLWCLLDAPLLVGCDLTKLDPFTLNLLTNDEVLDVNQDALGKQAGRVSQDGTVEVWAKELEDGSRAVGLFNRGMNEAPVTARWSDLGLTGRRTVRDLWRQQDLGACEGQFQATVPPHGVVLVKISAP